MTADGRLSIVSFVRVRPRRLMLRRAQHMMLRLVRCLAVLTGSVTALTIFACGPARAEFTVCNQTLDVVNLALGQEVEGAFRTEGWWTVGVNQCVNLIREQLANRYIYVYATDAFGHAILNGSTGMCIDRRRFTIRGIDECWQRGYIPARFYEVDTLSQIRWTFFLTGGSR